MAKQPGRRPGRPSREPAEGERVGLSLRVTPQTKRALDAAAAASGRSISQEAELWLEAAQRDRRILQDALALAYGEKIGGLMIYLGELLQAVANYRTFAIDTTDPGIADSFDNGWRYEQMAAATRAAIDRFRPEGAITLPKPTRIFPPSSPHDPADFDAMKGRLALRAEQELSLGTTLEQDRFNRLLDEKRPDPARNLLGEIVQRGKRRKR
jgi:hypothetical protein